MGEVETGASTRSIAEQDAYVRSLTRPHKHLLVQYFFQALAALPAFPIVMLVAYFKYHTLRYRFEDEGVNVSWGLLFRNETYLTYGKIQDIHVKRGLIERWLGIGSVDVQTASGSAGAEMTLAGLEDYVTVRDFLYRRMRGGDEAGDEDAQQDAPTGDDVVTLLREVRDELRATRAALVGAAAPSGDAASDPPADPPAAGEDA